MSRRNATIVTGASLVAGRESRAGDATFRALNPRTGELEGPDFHEATEKEILAAVQAAAVAFESYRRWPPADVARLLRAIADHVDALGDRLIDVADRETGLGPQRLTGELARTVGQLRMFADVVHGGAHLDAMIDTTDPAGQPPRPDVRRMLVPVGPVAVFGASNFPLAFSVPGGDTASALAAGCPVVAKAHPSHPATSELCARAILSAAEATGAPEGVFSLLQGAAPDVGRTLVLARQTKAVGFTGSHAVGRALFDLAAGRPEPIPVYAEMGSLNPIFLTESALAARSQEIIDGFIASMTMGTGQFCTKPGLVFVPDGPAGDGFIQGVARELERGEPSPMLSERIRQALRERVDATATLPGVEAVVEVDTGRGPGFLCRPGLLQTDLDTFLRHPELMEEHFGPVALVVRCPAHRMIEAARHLGGNLTATVHAGSADSEALVALEAELRERAGRLVWNGFPTGVAVTGAMHHGGPYPATTFAAHTSVGTTAIRRFLRPVAWQDAPPSVLPPALRDENPLGIPRLVDQRWTTEPVKGQNR